VASEISNNWNAKDLLYVLEVIFAAATLFELYCLLFKSPKH
jgi:hypothetical protein